MASMPSPHIFYVIRNLVAADNSQTASSSTSQIAKIKKVPKVLRDSTKDCVKYFEPRVLFLGPYHKGKVIPKEATQLKQEAAKLFMGNESPDATPDAAAKWLRVHHSICEEIDSLMEYYDLEKKSPNQYMSRDQTKILREENAWMLFQDGCAAMYFICGGDHTGSIIRSHEVVFAQQDLFLLENQLPYRVLELLMTDRNGYRKKSEKFIQLQMFNHRTTKEVNDATDAALGQSSAHTHLLEYLRTRLVTSASTVSEGSIALPHCSVSLRIESPTSPEGSLFPTSGSVSVQTTEEQPSDTASDQTAEEKSNSNDTPKSFSYLLLTASDLKARGIYFKANHPTCLTEVSFSNELIKGCLSLPSIIIDELSKRKFLNLLADEMSSHIPNNSEFASYLCFMDSLMDHPKDAKILREAKIIHNLLGSDTELVKLFNDMSANLVPDSTIYRDTQRRIQIHCGNRRKTWMAQLQNNYFSNPWTLVIFISAILVISLNMIQTYLSMMPPTDNADDEWERLRHVLKHIYMPMLLPVPLLGTLLCILFLSIAFINLLDLRAYKRN